MTEAATGHDLPGGPIWIRKTAMRNLLAKIWLWIRGLDGIDDLQGAYMHRLEHWITRLEHALDLEKTAPRP